MHGIFILTALRCVFISPHRAAIFDLERVVQAVVSGYSVTPSLPGESRNVPGFAGRSQKEAKRSCQSIIPGRV